jgi:hypothetical protein
MLQDWYHVSYVVCDSTDVMGDLVDVVGYVAIVTLTENKPGKCIQYGIHLLLSP